MKKTTIISVLLGALAIVGAGGYMFVKEFNNLGTNEKVKQENKLLVGTYKESTLSNGEKAYNRLYLEIVNNGSVVFKKNVVTADKEFVTYDKYENCVFYDLSDEIKNYTNNLGVYFWSKLNPNSNYVKVRTECIAFGVISGEVKLDDSGLFFVNIPSKDSEIPQVQHSYIYSQNKIGW